MLRVDNLNPLQVNNASPWLLVDGSEPAIQVQWPSATTPQPYERANYLGSLPDPGDNSVDFTYVASSDHPAVASSIMPVYALTRSKAP